MGDKPYVRSRSIRVVANLALALGIVAGVGGVAYALTGASRAGGAVTVPVDLRQPPPVAPADALPPGTLVVPPPGGWMLEAAGSTVPEQLLARGDGLVIGLAVLAGTLLLRGLLLSIADGRPFEPGNPRRLAGIAGLLLAATVAGPCLPGVAALLVLDRLDAAGPDSAYGWSLSWPLVPLLLVPVLLALAEAFRRGAELADDVRGLV